jgi:hypothetical protein
MQPPIDLTGQRFGKLVVIERLFERNGYLSAIWVCKCDCGNTSRVLMHNLRSGKTKSCGCAMKAFSESFFENRGKGGLSRKTHGLTFSREYRIWNGIKTRCYNEKREKYASYGGRGIVMSEEWRESFETFYKDMGPRPSPEHTVERRDNNAGYCKENCYWATREEQNRNKRSNRYYEYNGVRKIITDWCADWNVNCATVDYHLQQGMSFDEVVVRFTAPKG